jgi:hypothetical protein
LPTKSQLQAGSLSTTFLTSLALASFLTEAKQTSQTFPRLTTSLGALGRCLAIEEDSPPRVTNATKITSQSSSAHKEDLTQPLAWISHKSQFEVKGEVLKAQGCVFSLVEPATSKGETG